MSTRPVAARPSRFYNGGAPADRVLQVQSSPRRQRAAVRLFRGEAVEEAVAAGALEIVLAAAAVGPARGVRRSEERRVGKGGDVGGWRGMKKRRRRGGGASV